MTRKTGRARPEPARGDRRGAALLSLALAVATFAVYANGLAAAFVFDDAFVIVENPHLGKLWPPGPLLLGVRGGPTGGRPLTSLSFNLNALVAGRSPAGYRVVNVLIHAAAGILLFLLLRFVLGSRERRDGDSRDATPAAFAIALLWLVHPLQTESVTYISQRAESLMGLFFLAAVCSAVRGFAADRAAPWFRCAAAAATLAVLAKEVGVVAPLVILAYDALIASGSVKRALARHRSLYAGLALSWAVAGALQLWSPRGESVSASSPYLTPWDYLRHQAVAVPRYLKLAVWPSPLVIDYGYPPPLPAAPRVVAGVAVLALLAAATVWALRRRPLAGLAALAGFLILAPSSSVVPILSEVVAEHRMYLPLACVLAVLVGGAFEVGHRMVRAGSRRAASVERVAGRLLLSAAVLALAFVTWQRNRDYRSDEALWRDAVAKVPDNPRALSNLGWALLRAGRDEEALARLESAVAIRPRFFEANGGASLALEHLGRVADALPYMRRAVDADRTSVAARESLVRQLLKLERWGEAVEAARAYAEQFPDSTRANSLYGSLLARTGRPAEAAPYLERARRLSAAAAAGASPP